MNALNDPPEAGMPIDAFQQTARRRGRHYVITDALSFHFRPCKAGIIAPDLHLNGHIIPSFLILFIVSSSADEFQINCAFPLSGSSERPNALSYSFESINMALS